MVYDVLKISNPIMDRYYSLNIPIDIIFEVSGPNFDNNEFSYVVEVETVPYFASTKELGSRHLVPKRLVPVTIGSHLISVTAYFMGTEKVIDKDMVIIIVRWSYLFSFIRFS